MTDREDWALNEARSNLSAWAAASKHAEEIQARLDEAVRLLEDARDALDGSDDIDAFLLTWADDVGVFLAKARP